MHIEPETEIVQSHFCGQASLKPGQLMGTLPSQTKGVQEFIVDRFDDLPNARQPAAQGFGPTRMFAHLMRWRHQLDLILLVPPTSWSLSRKPFVGHIRPMSRQSSAGQPWRRGVTSGKQGGSQVLIMRARTSKTKARNDSLGRDAQQEMEAFIPADAITPPDICLTSQPAQSAPLRITGHRSRAVEYFIGRVLRLQKLHQKQGEGGNCIPVGSLQPMALATIRQLRKRLSQVLVCIAGKRSLALKLHPLSKQRQRDHLTSARASAWGPGLGLSGSSSDWQKSSTITYSVVKKVSRSIISELLFSRIGLISLLYGLDLFFFKSFLSHTKRLRFQRMLGYTCLLTYSSHWVKTWCATESELKRLGITRRLNFPSTLHV